VLTEEAGVLAREGGVWSVLILSVILMTTRNKLKMIRNAQNDENMLFVSES
jgi:hypothetical protein